jgi:protein TonB
MSTRGTAGGEVSPLTAHERFKARSGLRFRVSFLVAIALHLVALWWGPALRYDGDSDGGSGEVMRIVQLTPPNATRVLRLEVPAPPARAGRGERGDRGERLAAREREATPVRAEPRRRVPKLIGAPAPRLSAAVLSPESEALLEAAGRVSQAPPAVEVPPLPPPAPAPPGQESELGRFRPVNALMEKPLLVNRGQVKRALLREYPRSLQRAGVEGAVIVWFWIDEDGKVEKYEIRGSSGNRELDAAAERVIPIMKFRPARERGEAVPVVVTMPIRFEVE